MEKSPHTRDERGATAVEYGLLIALIAVVIIGTVILLGSATGGLFSTICTDPSPLC